MGSDTVVVRLGEKTKAQVLELSRKKKELQSDFIRKAVLKYIQGETESNEMKEIVAKKFAEGKISFEEMVRILGYEEAKLVAFYVDIAEKSFQEGI